jgi:hypothetical protein
MLQQVIFSHGLFFYEIQDFSSAFYACMHALCHSLPYFYLRKIWIKFTATVILAYAQSIVLLSELIREILFKVRENQKLRTQKCGETNIV